MRRTTVTLLAMLVFGALGGVASAQAMFTASVGNVFGGDAASKRSTWAVAIGGGGSHGIGSELEFSETRDFFETAEGAAPTKIVTLMPSIFVMVPVNKIRPYGIFGFGFIRQRTEGSGGLFSGLSNDDFGYSVGGGLTFQFARHAGLRADLRHFKVRKADGVSFQRFLVGIVLGG